MMIDRQLIRDNLNFLCLFRQSVRNMKIIHEEYTGSDFTYDEFKALCNSCWNEKFGFLSIVLTKTLDTCNYKKNFEAC